ncbi:MAG: hypothetical protein WC329_00085 [Candidatus Omnitrophota bacterium]
MQKKIIVLMISVISLCYGGSLYAWGDNWGNYKTAKNIDVYNGSWSSFGGGANSARENNTATQRMDQWNRDIIWEGGVCKNYTPEPLTTVFSWDALSQNISGLDVQYKEGSTDVYALNSLGNHLFSLTASTNNDSVIWSYNTASGTPASKANVPSVTVASFGKAFVSIASHEGAEQTGIDIQFDAGSGVEKITFGGFTDSEAYYIAGYLDVATDPGVDLTVKISDNAKSLEIYDKHHPDSSLIASMDEEMRVFINLQENGKVTKLNEQSVAKIGVACTISKDKNGELVWTISE